MTYLEYMNLLQTKVIDILNQGINPWQLMDRARNGITERRYSGANALMLNCASVLLYNGDMRWYTFNQAKNIGSSVKKGEKATPAYFFQNQIERPKRDEEGNIVKDQNGLTVYESVRIPPIFKVYYVFNAQQLDPIPIQKDRPVNTDSTFDREAADAILSSTPVRINYENTRVPFYSPGIDEITLPPRSSFPDLAEFYSTAFHEMAHSTGAINRLARNIGNPFGSEPYAIEELVAEITALSICESCDMKYTYRNSADYIGSWLKAIKSPDFKLSSIYSQVSKASRFLEHPEDRERLIAQVRNNEDEILLYNGERYLHIQRSDSGEEPWDYTLYDNALKDLDGGRMGSADTKLSDAIDEISKEHNLDPAVWKRVSLNLLDKDYSPITEALSSNGEVLLFNGSQYILIKSTDKGNNATLYDNDFNVIDNSTLIGTEINKSIIKEAEESFRDRISSSDWEKSDIPYESIIKDKAAEATSQKQHDTPQGNEAEPPRSPVVRFTFSENYRIPINKDMTLTEADKLLSAMNDDTKRFGDTIKTRFSISFELDGKEQEYKGRYDVGNTDETLIEHISNATSSFLKDRNAQEKIREKYGDQKLEEIIDNKRTVLKKVVPALTCHQSLDDQAERSEQFLNTLSNPNVTTVEREFIEYSKAVLDWVEKQRNSLNAGQAVEILNPPQLEDFQYIMPENPERIKTVYISGPITADPNYAERFKKAEESLSKAGYKAINPVEIVKGKIPENASAAETWRRAMEIDLEALRTSDAVVILNKNGMESMGMDIETHMATRLNIPLVTLDHILEWKKTNDKQEDIPAKRKPTQRSLR